MIINPFISIDEQLADIGWKKLCETTEEFIFVKKWGIEVFEKAAFDGKHIRFLWPMSVIPDAPGPVDEKELALFAAKIKEWRRQNECTDKGGRHFSKKQS